MTQQETDNRKLLLVTGLSGAGMSSTLKALEDIGWQAVDNLPLSLVEPLLNDKQGHKKSVAIGIDSRTWGFTATGLIEETERLRNQNGLDVGLLYLDCQDQVLQQRFTETRRVHPLAVDRPLTDGILSERRRMDDIKSHADYIIDTTELNIHGLRRHVAGEFALETGKELLITVLSFGFKKGLPRTADLVFDARFIDNPHWDMNLRPLTGLDTPVIEKVKKDKDYPAFLAGIKGLLETVLPRYHQEGKNYLTLAIGCTGGKHRSVAIAEELRVWLHRAGYNAALRHRDLEAFLSQRKENET
ncbi:MAG: RNase adapter RapZ [Alphaproteobacteria bacterium]|nr:RNase adapter RapZ [Alphaproteobacteria bacterium]